MRSIRFVASFLAAAFFSVALTGCSTAPKTQAEKQSLQAEAEAALQSMTAKDSSLASFVERGAGYAVFPSVGKAGLIAGGAYGRGILFEGGEPSGFVELNQGSVGAQIGAQTYAELVVFENENAVGRLKAGNFDLGAAASAVAIKAGVAATARFENGVAVFTQPKGGLMAEASITGQKLNYQPMDQSEMAASSSGGRSSRTDSDAQIRTETRTETRPRDGGVEADVDVDRK